MVEVYKTNVKKKKSSERILQRIIKKYPDLQVSFDLDDCDRILRCEGSGFDPAKVRRIVRRSGYRCKIL